MEEIRVKAKNTTNMTIKKDAIVFGKGYFIRKPSKLTKILIWLRLKKHKIYHIEGFVKGIDTSSFNVGDVLYFDPNKPGNLITKKPE